MKALYSKHRSHLTLYSGPLLLYIIPLTLFSDNDVDGDGDDDDDDDDDDDYDYDDDGNDVDDDGILEFGVFRNLVQSPRNAYACGLMSSEQKSKHQHAKLFIIHSNTGLIIDHINGYVQHISAGRLSSHFLHLAPLFDYLNR